DWPPVLASFRGTVQNGLPLEIGDTVQILEKCEGKLCFSYCHIKEAMTKGIFPCSYIHLKAADIKNKGQFETVVPKEDTVITEMTSTLRDWGTMWKQLYVKNEGDLFHRLWHVMNEILDLRRQVLLGHLTHDRMKDVKQHITARLDWGNESLFGLVKPELLMRTGLLTLVLCMCLSVCLCVNVCAHQMEHRHRKKETPVPASTHHLFVHMKSLMSSNLGEELEVFFFIYDSRENRPLSERFFVKLNKNGVPKSPEKTERQCTLFVDLGSGDLRKDVYIVVHIIRIGRMGAGEKKNTCSVQYRRPYGCAVVSIADLLTFLISVYTVCLAVALQLLHGDIEQLRREYMAIFTRGVSITRKLGFSDVIMPGEMRNDLYITLEKGEFDKGGKTVARNVEITVYTLDMDGQILRGHVTAGSGEPGADEYHSFVLYHNNSPRWAEQIKLPIPVDMFRGSHVRFEFRHCSTKDKGEKKLFGFSFVPLMQEDGRTLPDGTHELIVHKRNSSSIYRDNVGYSRRFLLSAGDMLDLLKWRAHPERISDSLSKLKEIDGSEIVKVDSVRSIPFTVHIINLLQDSKFQHFKPVMDTYIETKDWKWIMLFALATGNQNEEEFRCCMHELFMSIRFFLSRKSQGTSPVTHTQAVFLRTFPAVYGELLKLFTVREVATFVRETLGSLPATTQADCPLEAVKLQCIAKTVESQLYTNPESRCILLPVVLRLLQSHMQEQKDLVMCGRILTSMLSLIRREDTGEFVACLLALLKQMKDKHYQQLLQSFTSKDELRDFLLQLFTVFRILIRPEMFPKDWTVMRLCKVRTVFSSIFISFFFLLSSPGEHKLNFIPAMIGPFLEVTLVPQPDLRNVMIPIFHDMMDWEQRRSGNFKQVEAKLIDKLDSLMSEGKGDETYRELFNSIIPLFGPYPSLLKKIERETWRESGISLIATVTRLMERLLDYRDCMKLGEVDGKKIGCTVSLLNFYKTELNKEEMYIRYIHKLYDLHMKAQNFTEASYTLLLYDELLEWSERPLREFLNYPMQSEWQRKEYLHLTIIQNFDRGKCWENGILLCRELADQYESYYDYRNLSKMRMMEASLYDKIMDQQRLEPEFFRVGFYGKKFPFFLRNKEFVCRGHDYERLEAFQQRMLSEFPHAIAMQHANQPDQTIYQAEAQSACVQACIFFFVCFFFSLGVQSLWVERTTLTLVQSLPGISRWFEVEKRELVEVSPLENAIEVIENKNLQLRTLITQCQTRQMQNINPLTMCLNGVIDAAVNGGLARYQEAFFVKDYIMNHPEDGDKIGRLRELMFEQAQILEFGLAVHEKFVPQDMRPLHKKLVDQFHLMKSSLGIQVNLLATRFAFSSSLISSDHSTFFHDPTGAPQWSYYLSGGCF
uniref:Dedicator of cytokinesis 4b n=1 Tax=Astyanax mexicanus TaxID=7994 RepID=A0A8B9LN99_ASTMX